MKYALLMGVVVACTMGFLLLAKSPDASEPVRAASIGRTDVVNAQQAAFAAGCFWGVEATFRKIDGVVATTVGFSGGHTKNPTYHDVCTDLTGHAETVLVTFDPAQVSYAELLDAFWSCHDPTTLNRQGPDTGTQYRSVIFYRTPEQEKIARASLKEVEQAHVFKGRIVTEIVAAGPFYPAEDYHQQYFEKEGSAASCHVGIATVHTKLAAEAARQREAAAPTTAPGPGAWKMPSDAELRARLTAEQYAVTRKADTEAAYSGIYWDEHRAGVYRCVVCGQPLFKSSTKFDSHSGWPSFFEPIDPKAVIFRSDSSFGMDRTEVLCSRCQSHLGHVFDDGPKPTGQRFCMNSAALELLVDVKTPPAGK